MTRINQVLAGGQHQKKLEAGVNYLAGGKVMKIIRYTIYGLPLVGAAVSNLLLNSARTQQFSILIVLIWFQVFILFEVFFLGN